MTRSASRIQFKKKTPIIDLQQPMQESDALRVVADRDGKIMFLSAALAKKLGGDAQDFVGRKLLDTILFQDFDAIVQKDDRAVFNSLSQGTIDNAVHHLKDGDYKVLLDEDNTVCEFHFNWINARDGLAYLVGGLVENERKDQSKWTEILNYILPDRLNKKTDLNNKIKKQNEKPQAIYKEKKLSASDLQHLTQGQNQIYCVMNGAGEILRANDVLYSWLDVRTQHDVSLDAIKILNYIQDDDRAIFRQYLQSLHKHDPEHHQKEDNALECEARLSVHGHDSVWVSWRLWKSQKEDDIIYCTGIDISSVKKAESVLLRKERELFEAQALARIGHWRWVVGQNAIEWSDQIYSIFGVEDGDFKPTLDNANALIHKRDVGHMVQAFQRAIIEQNEYEIDFRVNRPDGKTSYVRCEGRCEKDAHGEVIALYGVMQDVTEQTEYEMELQAAKEGVEQAYAAKSRFLANMSHELRTPLNAIIGFSDMIRRQMLGALGSDKYVEYAESIHDSGEHLLSLITDILDMSKIEAGKYELDLEDIALGEMVNSALRMISSRAQEGVLTVTSHIDAEGPVVLADRRAVMQILLNIMSNAVKFTEPGGEISARIEEFENHVTIRISDTGIGIPANKLSAVLKPFEQVSSAFTRNHEGSGLGLAITKELIELHGGTLLLESNVDQGTTASIRLPREAVVKQSA